EEKKLQEVQASQPETAKTDGLSTSQIMSQGGCLTYGLHAKRFRPKKIATGNEAAAIFVRLIAVEQYSRITS
ncbi:MAG: hypothetical protein K9M84_11040, partial [Spirochaetia bacterium]|nr:hypothetical protein [Spirochaetia bacterium]